MKRELTSRNNTGKAAISVYGTIIRLNYPCKRQRNLYGYAAGLLGKDDLVVLLQRQLTRL